MINKAKKRLKIALVALLTCRQENVSMAKIAMREEYNGPHVTYIAVSLIVGLLFSIALIIAFFRTN